MKVFYGVLAMLCVHSMYSQATPSVSGIIITQKPIRYIGSAVELSCVVSNSTELPVVWIKTDINRFNEPVVISNGSIIIINDTRFSLIEINYTNYRLQIKDVKITDAGFYQCQIPSQLDFIKSAEVELEVRLPPKIFDITNRSLVFQEGEPVKLACEASGYPVPRISWRRESSAVLPTGGSLYKGNVLYIPSITKEERGTYYCIAENGVGPGDKCSISVEVEFPPIVTAPKAHYFQALRHDADLDCVIEAYPPPVVVWIKHGVQLLNKEQYKFTNFTTAHKTNARIRIVKLEKIQFGTYTCQASNKLGTAEATVFIQRAINKVCPPDCGI